MKNVISLIVKIKKVLKKILTSIIIFFITLVLIDFFWCFIFDKDIKDFNKYKIKISEKSTISQSDINKFKYEFWLKNVNWYPYWEELNRWPTINYKHNKQEKCRILWIWGSIIRGSWVDEKESYFHILSNNFKNSEFINISIPWSMPLQQIIRFEKEKLLHDTDLIIWEIWHDDLIYFTYSNGILYNSKVILDDNWYISLYNGIPENINLFLINNSIIYNKLLKIKLLIQINSESKKEKDITEEYILSKVKKQVDDYLKINWNNKVIFIISSFLWTKNKIYEDEKHLYILNKLNDLFKNNSRVEIINEEKLLNIKDFTQYNLDDVHLNTLWNKVVWEKLYEYIKTNKLLDEKCY